MILTAVVRIISKTIFPQFKKVLEYDSHVLVSRMHITHCAERIT